MDLGGNGSMFGEMPGKMGHDAGSSGKLTDCYLKWLFIVDLHSKNNLKMVIFHSYVSLPEGNKMIVGEFPTASNWI